MTTDTMTQQLRAAKPWRAYFIPNVPRDPFGFPTATLAEAIAVWDALTAYSLTLREVTSSVGGVEKWDTDGETEDWYDLDGDEEAEGVEWDAESFDPEPRLVTRPEGVDALCVTALARYRGYLHRQGIKR